MSEVQIFKLREEKGYLDGTFFNDKDLFEVPTDVILLSLENSEVTDEGISNLPFLSEVKCIDLDSTNITDKSMDIISKFITLEELWVEDVKITDAGFKKLVSLPNLKYISFWDTDISDEAYYFVKKELPNLKSEG